MDWHHLRTAGDTSLHAAAAVFFKDSRAAALERRALRNTELRQHVLVASLPDGSTGRDSLEAGLEEPQVFRFINHF